MKSRELRKLSLLLATSVVTVGGALSASAAPVLLADYKVADYNATTGVWADSSSNSYDATSAGSTKPTLISNATPNGSSAVNFDGTQYLSIGNSGIASASYTIFAYLSVDGAAAASRGIVGSTYHTSSAPYHGGLEYALVVSGSQTYTQQVRRANISSAAASTPASSTDVFDSINFAGTQSAGNYRLNGAANGSYSGGPWFDGNGHPLTLLGAGIDKTGSGGGTPGDIFKGKIAEVRIYSGVLTDVERQTIEGELHTSYVPEPGSVMVLTGVGLVLAARRRRRA